MSPVWVMEINCPISKSCSFLTDFIVKKYPAKKFMVCSQKSTFFANRYAHFILIYKYSVIAFFFSLKHRFSRTLWLKIKIWRKKFWKKNIVIQLTQLDTSVNHILISKSWVITMQHVFSTLLNVLQIFRSSVKCFCTSPILFCCKFCANSDCLWKMRWRIVVFVVHKPRWFRWEETKNMKTENTPDDLPS